MHHIASLGRRLACAFALLLLIAFPAIAQAYSVTATPSAASVNVGDSFTVTLSTDGSSDLRAYQLVYQFDPTRLQFMGAAPGGLATGASCSNFAGTTPDFAVPADSVIYDVGLLGCSVNGAGDLAVLTFKALAPGNANVDCKLVDFRNSLNQTTSATCSGTTTVQIPYSIVATAGAGGSIAPSGTVYVLPGGSQSFTITPTALYVIGGVTVDGVGQGAIGSYTFTNVSANHTIAATFTYLPVTNLNTGLRYPTIQSAVSAAATLNGHTLACGAATFNERVTVNKELTIQGAGETSTIVDGTGLAGTGSGFYVNSGIKNVTIRDLTVQNFAGINPNQSGGIYAALSNDNITVRNVTLKNNVGGAGFYANGPINGVLLDNLDVSGHTGGARGIVIWNGLKQNVTITNCDVYNNICCGIELQDGTASGVTLQNNNVHDNGDNGFGLTGLQGPGENVVSGNTVTNNGRFGIEIKNPNGSGLATGAGRVVVEGNTVSRTLPIGAEARDLAGIAAFRRGCLPGNVDVPNGAVIRNNIVSGYTQPSLSEGFGIVVEGTNHSVTGNTVTGCDVGIQRQAGHLPYGAPQSPPVDGDQSNVADTYFGRGNAAISCGLTVSGNTLSSNVVDYRDVPLTVAAGQVTNLNTLVTYCSIQSAVTASSTNDVISAGAGTYMERVTIPRTITLKGASEATAVLDGATLAGTGSGITVQTGVQNATIQDLTVKNYAGAGPNSYAGIYGVGGNSGLTVKNVTLKDNVGGSGFYANGPVNGLLLDNLDVSGHTNVAGAARGIVVWNGLKENITIRNCDVYNNNCCGIELQDGTASGVTMQNNNIHDNGDNGIGIVGLQGPGENVVSSNTLTNNGRFGIEIKNPNGSGLATGAGRIVVENNTVSRTVPIVDVRDIVGIAAFRRGVLAGNVDVPNGTVIRNNIVSGYTQPSANDGFGIVVEGTNSSVTGNTVSGCDVGIQRQYGNAGYPGDADQAAVSDYFARGNSPVACSITVSGNTLSNPIDTRDVPATLDTKFLTVNASGPGSVTKSPNLASYACGSTVTLTAVPTGDNYFAGWSGDATGTTNPLTITMDGDKTVTATFAANTHVAIVLERPRDLASAMASNNLQQYTGNGGWYFQKPGLASKAELYLSPSVDLGAAAFTVNDIAWIKYHTYNIANPSPVEFGAYLYTTGTTHGWYGERLTAEPYLKQNGYTPVQNAWSEWNSVGTDALTWNDTNNSGNQGYYGQPTLAQLQSGAFTWPSSQTRNYGPMGVQLLSFQTGSGWAGFNGYLDGISIALKNGTVYDVDLEATPYTLALTSGANGSASASPGPITNAGGATGYTHGTVVALTATPATGYHLAAWGGDASGNANPYNLTMTKDMAVTATFAIDQFTITATAGAGGSIAPAGATVVNYNGSQAYTITPATCYSIADVKVDGVSQGPIASYTFSNVTASHTIDATFALNTYAVNVVVSGPGAVTKSPDLPAYGCGSTVTLTAVPTGDNYFAGWSGDATGTTNPLVVTVDAAKNITATFAGNTHHAITLQRPRDAASAMASNNAQQNTGYGAWYFTKPGMASKAEMYLDPALDLGAAAFTVNDIASIKYHTYNIANPAPVEFGAYLYTTGTTHGWYGERLQAEPYFKLGGYTPVQNAWSEWNSQGASALTWNDTNNSGNQGYYGQPTLAQLQSGAFTWPSSQSRNYGPMGVKYLSFQTGSGWTSFNGYIDGISIALKDGNVYDVDLEATPYTLALSSGGNGTAAASPAPITLTLPPAFSATGYAHGTVVQLTATPATGYHLAAWGGDASGNANPYNLTMTKDMAVTATFAIDQFTITATAGAGGSIAPPGATVVNYNGSQAYTITPDPCYDVANVLIDGTTSLGAVTSYTFSNVTADHTIDATFVLKTFTITASAAAGGTISPSGAVVVNCGASQTFTIGADACNHVTDVIVDGAHLGVLTTYPFTNVTANHTIAVVVAPNNVAPALATNLSATQVRTGNDADGTTKITLSWTPPGDGSTVQIWRAGYGNYPEYDNGPAPGQVPAYPGTGTWTLTGVTAPGQSDEPPARDFWYYVAVSVSTCGVPATGPMTAGTLNYHLGDVSDGATACQGDNVVSTADISLLGSYYGATLADPPVMGGAPDCLDVGPTTTSYVDGRPMPDNNINFEDLVMFAINYYIGPGSPSLKSRGDVAKAATASGIGLATDALPQPGGTFQAALVFQSGGDVQALSAKLTYDRSVIEIVGIEDGELLAQQAGPAKALSAETGRVDVAVFGRDLTIDGSGVLARVTFKVIGPGDAKLALGDVQARSVRNQPVTLARILAIDPAKLPKAIELASGFPNPFSHSTTLVLGLPKAAPVRIAVYDIQGRAVNTLLNGVAGAGWTRVTWDGRSTAGVRAAPGAYLVRMDVEGRTFTKRVVMVR